MQADPIEAAICCKDRQDDAFGRTPRMIRINENRECGRRDLI
jgi:hypothetical protein